jgi:ribosomal protein S19
MVRSRWKVPFLSSFVFTNRFVFNKFFTTFKRNTIISSIFLNKMLNVHNGRDLSSIRIQNSMIGKKLGEFVVTKIIGREVSLKRDIVIMLKVKKKR